MRREEKCQSGASGSLCIYNGDLEDRSGKTQHEAIEQMLSFPVFRAYCSREGMASVIRHDVQNITGRARSECLIRGDIFFD